jgi:hypothetical protein
MKSVSFCITILFFSIIHSAFSESILFPSLAIVVHTMDLNHSIVLHESLNTWLSDTQIVVMHGHDIFPANRELKAKYIRYNGNPGCSNCKEPTHLQHDKNFGAHRAIAGILAAYDLYPSAEWIYVIEESNYVDLENMSNLLKTINSSVPLLLSGLIGPHTTSHHCLSESDHTHWSCCTNPNKACIANIIPTITSSVPVKQNVYKYDESAKSMVVDYSCADDMLSLECCKSQPWNKGINYGFPYRTSINGTYRPHFVNMHPIGPATYVVSRAMIDAIGRKNWERCVYALQCHNAEVRVMTCVLNYGYSLTHFPLLNAHVTHSVHSVDYLHQIMTNRSISTL